MKDYYFMLLMLVKKSVFEHVNILKLKLLEIAKIINIH